MIVRRNERTKRTKLIAGALDKLALAAIIGAAYLVPVIAAATLFLLLLGVCFWAVAYLVGVIWASWSS